MIRGVLAASLLLGGCMATPKPPPGPIAAPIPDEHMPDYVRRSFEPFSRSNAIAIAQREWRAFGSVVYDGPADTRIAHDDRTDQLPGLWQRVADYWWLSQDSGTAPSEWGSRYNENGTPYAGNPPAWSAAFISYVMRSAGAGTGFPYSPLHADYINAAARNEGALRAERPESYAPRAGDLICLGRLQARGLKYDDLPSTRFFGHCDIVTQAVPGQLSVVGGNVEAGVTMKHVPTTPDGMLATPDGRTVDPRYPWFVVLRVMYAT